MEWRRNGGEGISGEALGAGSLRVGREGKEGRRRSSGTTGWPGVREERAPTVVRHNGVEGGHFLSGIGRGVMGGERALPL
jgi:hypothetical protein